MTGGQDDRVERAAEELYGLRPEEFTAARESLARDARAAGDRTAADAIHRLRRPSVSAWLANLLVRERPDDAAELAELGRDLRAAQSRLSGDDLRRLTEARRQLVGRLVSLAGTLAADTGHPAADASLRELETTLHTALAGEQAAETFAAGRLTTALQAETMFGFGPGAQPAAPSPARPGRPRRTTAREPARTDDRAQLSRARDDVAAVRREADEAEVAAGERAGDAEDADERLRQASRRVDELAEAVRRARDERAEAERGVRAARRAADAARRHAERVRQRFTDLPGTP